MSMYGDDRRRRRTSCGDRWAEDDDLSRRRDTDDVRGPGDEDYGDRRSRGRPAEGAYGPGRSGGAYGDDAMPSGGSTRHGSSYGGGAMNRAAVSGGLGGTPPADGVGAVAGRIVGPGRMGGGRTGGMAGKGPKGYVRSDERIREDVCDRLTDDPDLDASSIDVQVKNGEVTLSGTVGTRWDRRHAEELLDDVSGTKHVQNNLRLQAGEERGGSTQPTNTDIGPTR